MLFLGIWLVACSDGVSLPATSQPTATQEVAAAPNEEATHTPLPEPTDTPTSDPSTATPTVTNTVIPTATHTPTPEPSTPTPVPTDTPTSEPIAPTATLPPPTPASDPASARVHWATGREYLEQEQWELAVEELNKAVAFDPSYELARRDLGFGYFVLGDYENAVVQLEKYLELVPDDPERMDIQQIIRNARLLIEHDVGSDEGLLVITNYVGGRAIVDIAGQTHEVPGTDEVPEGGQIAIHLFPGHYTVAVNGLTQAGERFSGDIEFDIEAGNVLEWPLYFQP